MGELPFYVYRILGEMGETVYIGKGSGQRLNRQMRRFASDGEIIERFSTERQAYRAEIKLIELHNPPLNRCSGGGGGIYGRSNARGGTENDLFEIAARIISTLRFPQRNFLWFDMRPTLERYVQALAEKYGPDEFAKRLLPYNIKVVTN